MGDGGTLKGEGPAKEDGEAVGVAAAAHDVSLLPPPRLREGVVGVGTMWNARDGRPESLTKAKL